MTTSMNLNDPRLELIHRSQMDGFTTEELALLERNLREDPGFREVYVRYANIDLALSAVAKPSPLPATPFNRIISALRRWAYRGVSEDPVSLGAPAMVSQLWLNVRVGMAVLAVGLLAAVLPFPKVVEAPCERIIQQTSAEVSYFVMQLIGTPVARQGLNFHSPGVTLQFVEACSGIRPTFILLTISGLLAGFVLNKTLNRAVLVLAMIPLGIVQKGLWVCAIVTLAVRMDPDIVNTWVFRQGTAINFTLSFITMLGLTAWLARSERKAKI